MARKQGCIILWVRESSDSAWPISYSHLIKSIFFIVWNQTQTDTALCWSNEFLSGSVVFMIIVVFSAPCKWLSKGIVLCRRLVFTANKIEIGSHLLLLCISLKTGQSNLNQNIISKYFFELGLTCWVPTRWACVKYPPCKERLNSGQQPCTHFSCRHTLSTVLNFAIPIFLRL